MINEQSLLGSILLKSKMFNAVCGIVTASDFTDPVNKIIYEAMLDLNSKDVPIDTLTVCELLKQKGLIEGVKASYVSSLPDVVPTAMHATAYAAIVRDKAIEREYESIMRVPENIDATMAKLDELSRRKRNTAEDATEMIYENAKERLEKRIAKGTVKPMKTGHMHLDAMLNGGFVRGCYYLISGVTGSGKTRWAVDVSAGLVKHGASVLYITLEMPLSEIEAMYVSNKYGFDYNKFNKGLLSKEIMETIYGNLEREKDSFAIRQHVDMENIKSMSPADVELCIEERLKYTPIDLVIVDYITLLKLPGFGDKAFELAKMFAAISRKMNAIALKRNIAVVALAQTSIPRRGEEGFELGDIGKSKEMMECAWAVAGIVRTKTSNELGLKFAKNRFAGLDHIKGTFDWSRNAWKELSAPEYETDEKEEQPF